MIHRQRTKRGDQVKVTFEVPDDGPTSVVGDFNAWNPGANPLRPKDGTRAVSLTLAAGRRYAFRYLRDDGRWFNDESADAVEPNQYGEENSVLDLTDGPESDRP